MKALRHLVRHAAPWVAFVCLAAAPTISVVACSRPPEAFVAADVTEGSAPLKVTFSNTSKNGKAFSWSFGDGATATSALPTETVSHEFTKAGSHVVTLTALNTKEPPERSEASVTITVRPGAVEKVELKPTEVVVEADDRATFTAVAFDKFGNPIPGIHLAFTANPAAGTIDEKGVLKATKKSGSTAKGVTVEASDGTQTRTASADIVVRPGPISRVELKSATTKVEAAKDLQFSAVALDQFDNPVPDAEITFSAGSTAGTIGKAGMLTAAKVAAIVTDGVTATALKGGITRTASSRVEIVPGPVARVSVAPSAPMIQVTTTQKFTAMAYDEFDNLVPDVQIAYAAVGDAGTIGQDGTFTASKKAGAYTDGVTATAARAGVTKSKSETITLTPGPLAQVTVSPATATLNIGAEAVFKAKAFDEHGNEIASAKFDWSLAGQAGKLSPEGSFTAGEKAGTYKDEVIAQSTLDGKSARSAAVVTIKPDPLATVTLSIPSVEAGSTVKLAPSALDRFGNSIADATFTLAIKDSKAGSLTADGSYMATKVAGGFVDAIDVKATQGQLSASATVGTVVIPGPLAQVGIAPEEIDLGIGMTQQFVAAGADQYGNRISGLTITWSVGASSGSSITTNGLFTAGKQPGVFSNGVTASATQGATTKSFSAKVTVDADRIVFSSDRDGSGADLYTMLTDGTGIKRITSSENFQGVWSSSPDRRRLLCFDSSKGVFSVDTDGQWLEYLIPTVVDTSTMVAAYPTEADWSPDGRRLVFVLFVYKIKTDNTLDLDSETSDIVVMDVDGANLVNITNSKDRIDVDPVWSPDGKTIVFRSLANGGTSDIFSINPDGSGLVQLTSDPASDVGPVFTPDGKRISFSSNRDGDYEIFVMNANGSGVTQITRNSANDGGAVWSPDGGKLVFNTDRDNPDSVQIYVMNSDGSEQVKLTSESTNYDAYWLPRKHGVPVTEDSIVFKGRSAHPALTPQEVLKQQSASVVRITTDVATGSGFIISSSGLILTNNHVIKDAKTITVELSDGRRATATVVGRDLIRDLAVIKIPVGNLQVAKLGDVGTVEVGSELLVLGYPLSSTSVNITRGLYSATKRDSAKNISWIQTDATINAGNSGGPVLNLQGEVVGVASRKTIAAGVEGTGFAIPMNVVKLVLDRLIKGETITM